MKTFTPRLGIILIVAILLVVAVVIFAGVKKNSVRTESQEYLQEGSETLASKAEFESVDRSPDAPPIQPVPTIEVYIYPGATIISTKSAELNMESQESVEEITDWYKKKIDELQFNAKSTSQTNTNGVIFNKLSAAKPGENLEVSIKKDQSTSNVSITVDRPL
jgi:hypothetical protein